MAYFFAGDFVRRIDHDENLLVNFQRSADDGFQTPPSFVVQGIHVVYRNVIHELILRRGGRPSHWVLPHIPIYVAESPPLCLTRILIMIATPSGRYQWTIVTRLAHFGLLALLANRQGRRKCWSL